MTEWGVIGVIITLVGLFATVGKPVITLNSNLVRLNTKLDQMDKTISDNATRNTNAHERIWEHNKIQDNKLDKHDQTLIEHEVRLTKLEEHDHVG